MLLDDNEINLKIEKKLLEKKNARDIETLTNGNELVEKSKMVKGMIPIISGSETLIELKKDI